MDDRDTIRTTRQVDHWVCLPYWRLLDLSLATSESGGIIEMLLRAPVGFQWSEIQGAESIEYGACRSYKFNLMSDGMSPGCPERVMEI